MKCDVALGTSELGDVKMGQPVVFQQSSPAVEIISLSGQQDALTNFRDQEHEDPDEQRTDDDLHPVAKVVMPTRKATELTSHSSTNCSLQVV